jgi:hypothetical protein
VTDFKKLKVWQRAHVMALDVHRVAGQIRGAKFDWFTVSQLEALLLAPRIRVVLG